ncbi:putative P-loop ATPase [Desulfitispora alkaliphila]|uniref:VapE domain-containing protein n=1 Tax=Desulfitispora alkaliphila TaxID=622674 RepID=UPI003D2008EC
MKFIISTGNSRKDKFWKEQTVSWEEFTERLSRTTVTSETQEEYLKMKKYQQDNVKDVGGFVAGQLKDGRRTKHSVLSRSMLSLDMDYADDAESIAENMELLYGYAAIIYSTHKHKPEKPRLRLIIPLSRVVTADEYQAVSRMIAKEIGIELFDDTTYEPNRLMYWPSTSSDGEYFYREIKGDFLNPDGILKSYENWQDSSSWPVSSRQTTLLKKLMKKQADPIRKEGLIGAFCRRYTIEEAIETFLSDIYEPSVMPERYDYTPADSTAGVVIYNGKYAYSHHATDPACGQLCNAFDLVRIHLYGDLDEEVDEKKQLPSSKSTLPSVKAMLEFCLEDEKVKRQLAKERAEEINREFEKVEEDECDGDKSSTKVTPSTKDKSNNKNTSSSKENSSNEETSQSEDSTEEDDLTWQLELELNKNGTVKDTPTNILTIMRHDSRLQAIAYNQMNHLLDVNGELPWEQVKDGWNDADFANLKMYLDRHYGIWSPAKVKDALTTAASERLFHPIRDYLDALPVWDGTERVDRLLIDYLGAEDNPYTRAIMRKTLVAAVARIYEPGTKFDYILVLNGPQGIGKSTFFAKLGGKWFSDSLTVSDMRDKSGAEKLQGYWILELGELAGLRKIDVETVKSFITRTDDKFRHSYGVNVESHPRQCIIVGSTNSTSGFLRDVTGNRRFWPVRVKQSKKKVWEMTDIDQIWAEALEMYRAGEPLILIGEEEKMAYEEQRDAMEADDREGLVEQYLEKPLPDNWAKMDIYERRSYLAGQSEFGEEIPEGANRRDRVCCLEIWCECFGKERNAIRRTDSYEIEAILMRIGGWKRYDGNKRGNIKFPIYDSQRAFVRDEEEIKSQ